MSGVQIKLEGEGERRVVQMTLASGHQAWIVLEPFSVRDAARWLNRTSLMSDKVLTGASADDVRETRGEKPENDGDAALLAMGEFVAAHIADWELTKQKPAEGKEDGKWEVVLQGKPTGQEVADILNANVRNLAMISHRIYRAQTLEGDIKNLEK